MLDQDVSELGDGTVTDVSSHPRTLGWVRTTALAMGGSNQSLFLLGVLVVGQGTAAVPLLVVGLILSLVAMPGWIELILMWPNRVGGIAAVCGEAFPQTSCRLRTASRTPRLEPNSERSGKWRCTSPSALPRPWQAPDGRWDRPPRDGRHRHHLRQAAVGRAS